MRSSIKMNCPSCKNSILQPFVEPCCNCNDGSEFKPKTNADRIRSMGDIELANFLSGLTMCGCVNCPMYYYYPEESDECVKQCNTAWQEWVRKESEDK